MNLICVLKGHDPLKLSDTLVVCKRCNKHLYYSEFDRTWFVDKYWKVGGSNDETTKRS